MDYLAMLKSLDTYRTMKVVAEPSCENSELSEKRFATASEATEAHPGMRCLGEALIEQAPLREVERKCWHCGGETNCSCITCAEGLRLGEKGQCIPCHGTGKVFTWVQ
jgi:hypothetical protein